MTPARTGLIALLVTVVAGFGFYTLALKPKHQEAADLETQIATKQDELAAARTLLAANRSAQERFDDAYSTVVRLGKAVPADDDVRSLLVQLHAAAKDADVRFSGFTLDSAGSSSAGDPAVALPPGATVGPAGFPVMQFSFTFRGEFFRLSDFFGRLHDFVEASNDRLRVTGRLLALDSLQLAPDGDGFPHISATVSAKTYLLSPLEGATAGATSAAPGGAAPGGAAATPTPAASTSTASTTTSSTGGTG